jgi:uncharacterized membrane protein YphA (DoxX/SURF4 family)
MATSAASLDAWVPRAQGLLRIVTACLFLEHGTAKLFKVPHVAMFLFLAAAGAGAWAVDTLRGARRV